jgi:RNA polymerase sigma-70 factor (ECF subfamily)
MPGAARPFLAGARPHAWEPMNRLRALADLVDDALAALGAQPAFASEAVNRRPSLHGGAQHPIGGPRTRGRASRNLHVRPEPPAPDIHPGDGPTDADQVEGTVEDDHAETWRLVTLAQGGDGEAFGLLYDRYVDMVFRFIYFRVNDRALAEDFTSETFLRALRRIGSISYQGRDIGAWFVTIARNIVFDHSKSARNRLESTTGETLESKDYVQSTETAVLDTLQSEQLMAAVARLGDEQRECVMLRFVHGLSVNETASVMGKNDGAIKALQHRAVRKLADLVGSELR